jgi:hypothetical protein
VKLWARLRLPCPGYGAMTTVITLSLSLLNFSFALEYAVRQARENQRRLELNKIYELLVYVDILIY